MPLVSMRQLLDHAAENGYGLPAFNVNNLEQVQAVMSAADEVGAPVILQASAGARKYAGESFVKHLIQAATEAWPHIPLVMHQDHGTSPKVCQGALDLGFGSVMMDGSLMEDGKTPASFDYNVDVTRKVVEMAHRIGATVEGELGCLGNLETGEAGEEDGIGAEGKLDHSQMLTDPEEAAVFVKATQLDALAIAIGTSHGAYKFSRKPTVDILAISRVKEIHARIPGFEVAQAAQFTFDRDAHLVRHVHHLARHFDVVVEGRRGLAVFHQRAVHHHRAKAQVDGALAHLGRSAVVLVHDEGNVGESLDRRLDQVLDEGLARVLARASAGLQDDGSAHFVRSRHHGLHLLQVVDVEGRDAIAVGSGMVEQFAHRNEGHGRGVRGGLMKEGARRCSARQCGGNRLVTRDFNRGPVRRAMANPTGSRW